MQNYPCQSDFLEAAARASIDFDAEITHQEKVRQKI